MTPKPPAERTAEQRAAEAIAENRVKDEFLAMLGHELRNSLAPIRAALDVLRRQPAQPQAQDIIARQVSHLTRQVDDLLDISRITSGKIELRKQPVEFAAVIAQAIEITGPVLHGGAHQLEVQVAAAGLGIDADPARLAQIFANLLTNAAKYSDAGSRIVISAERVSGRIRAQVRDHGFGIAPEMLAQIFEVFVQQPQTLDRAQGGLGLAIVRSLVEAHGGTIAVHSAGLGQWSLFTVELPAVDGLVAPAVHEWVQAPREEAAVGKSRILIIDDNQDAADMLQLSLEALGYAVTVAHDGFDALRKAPLCQPDIALVDIGLPGMSGYELAPQLRACAALAQLQLVAVTGYGQASDLQRSRAAGFVAHLIKPVNLQDLDQLLKTL